jgi:hypothetical protein
MIYSPAYGDIAFTVPLFGEFMLRVMPTGHFSGSKQNATEPSVNG